MTDAAPPPPAPAPTPAPARKRRWIGYALAASLAVNLAVLGLVAGLAIKGPPPPPGPEMGLWRYGAALPPPYRRDLMRALREGRQDWRAERERLGGQRIALAEALTAEPYDKDRVADLLDAERSLLEGLATHATGLLLAQIDRMDAAARAEYAARLLAPPPDRDGDRDRRDDRPPEHD